MVRSGKADERGRLLSAGPRKTPMPRPINLTLSAALIVVLAVWPTASGETGSAGGFSSPAGSPSGAAADGFRRAIREAERDAERLERGGTAAPAGWGISEISALVALILAVVLLFALARWTRRIAPGAAGREMRILDRMATGRQTALLMVRVRDRDCLLAEHPGGLSLLAEWPAPNGDGNPVPVGAPVQAPEPKAG